MCVGIVKGELNNNNVYRKTSGSPSLAIRIWSVVSRSSVGLLRNEAQCCYGVGVVAGAEAGAAAIHTHSDIYIFLFSLQPTFVLGLGRRDPVLCEEDVSLV